MNPGTMREDDTRLAALVTPYGVGTRSYNRSAEKKEIDRQRRKATETLTVVPESVEMPLMCDCPQRPWPHEVFIHRKLWLEANARPELRGYWPWKLTLAAVDSPAPKREQQSHLAISVPA